MSIKVHGLDVLEKQLLELGAQMAAKVLAQAARRAFAPVLETAKALVPRDTGALADSLRMSTVTGPGDAVVRVGISIGGGHARQARIAAAAFGEAQAKVPPARRWHFIELGTSQHSAHPYLRPALDSNAARVLELLKVELRASIDKAIKKGSGQ